MAKKKRGGSSYKAQYTAYKVENRAKKNKLNRLGKRLIENENDVGAETAIKIVMQKDKFRQKPGAKGWYHPQEQRLMSMLRDKDPKVVQKAAAELNRLRYIYNDKRPSATRCINQPIELPTSIKDELYSIGIIDEKRIKSTEQSKRSIRKRKSVSK